MFIEKKLPRFWLQSAKSGVISFLNSVFYPKKSCIKPKIELSFAKNLEKSAQLGEADYMGCQQQRRTNIDDLKELLRLSELYKGLKLNDLCFVSLFVKYKLLR